MKLNKIRENPVLDFYTIITEESGDSITEKLSNLNVLFSHDDVMDKFLSGGYPFPVLRNNREEYDIWMENYFKTYLSKDIRGEFPWLNDYNYRKFISMLSQLSGSILNKDSLHIHPDKLFDQYSYKK